MNKEELDKLNNDIASIYCTVDMQRTDAMDKIVEKEGWTNFHKHWSAFNKSTDIAKMINNIKDMEVEIINNIPPELMDFVKDSFGSCFTIKEFITDVESGAFVDSDGDGYLIYKGKRVENIPFYPSLVRHPDIDLSRYDGVDWYNK